MVGDVIRVGREGRGRIGKWHGPESNPGRQRSSPLPRRLRHGWARELLFLRWNEMLCMEVEEAALLTSCCQTRVRRIHLEGLKSLKQTETLHISDWPRPRSSIIGRMALEYSQRPIMTPWGPESDNEKGPPLNGCW